MIKHVILWTLKDDFSASEKAEIKKGIKEGLEGLAGKIDGMTDIRVYTEALAGSNCDLILDSTFIDSKSLSGYSSNPLHVAVADTKVRPFTASRVCLNYEI